MAQVPVKFVKFKFKFKELSTNDNLLNFNSKFNLGIVWASTSETNIGKLQCVQNFAARIVTGTKKFEHITPILKDLKWLPVAMKLYTGCIKKN